MPQNVPAAGQRPGSWLWRMPPALPCASFAAGHAHAMKGFAPQIRGVSFEALPADRTLDADWPLQDPRRARDLPCHPARRKPQSAAQLRYRALRMATYRGKLLRKEFRGTVTRHDKAESDHAGTSLGGSKHQDDCSRELRKPITY